MYTETGVQHHNPHLHAYYQDASATFRIDSGEIIAGELPRRQQRLVEAWIELYRDELMDDWKRADAGEPVLPVPPLQK